MIGNANTDQPTEFGCPPECIKAARIVLNAIQSDAYTPLGPPIELIKKDIV
jgi:hypothetical protein